MPPNDFGKCAACRGAIKSSQYLSCNACKLRYDIDCIGISAQRFHSFYAPDQERRNNWKCPECSSKTPKTCNRDTPVRPPFPPTRSGEQDRPPHDDYVTKRNTKLGQKKPAPPSPNNDGCSQCPDDEIVTEPKLQAIQNSQPIQSTLNPDMEPLVSELRLMRQTMAQMQNDFAERFEGLASKITAYEKHMQEKDKLILDLKSQVAVLQEQVDRQSHESLRSELDILGLTETPNENPYHLVLTTAQKIGLAMDERDLDYVRRVGPRGKEAEDRLPRPLVVSFTRRTKREEFLKQAKARRCLDSKDVAGSGPERKMYVNERLTTGNRQLFRTARIWTKDQGFKHCWVRNGMVYVRKGEGRDGSPAIPIRTSEDLQRMSAKNNLHPSE